ncbi:asparagine synthase (glutamine-hydrolyzing) [Bradyrhizobium sp. AUGA SZCCT0158]|uniref:asparagine synthase (glutamine-hydrolyzing) n=1 Tax=Bradyrhizobium sp. AUGA SZCCT0158 TaxID=2807661 RepID=UPI001BA9375C|nr:asparagine synthase (glutamine-hydrolyzing) [Bradyrhizobium sp. AUGA SZCCT0158]MBR1199504.1 asparagine synthase (glutamine-hydrolyzing) [Bradyrhizobium sp. AUGA SZCCT0158]
MCGIAALISPKPIEQSANILAMCDVLRHRGPDGEGYVLLADRKSHVMDRRHPVPPDFAMSRAALGHRRLAIIDLTEAGAQPMQDTSGRYWVTYNGEIYNFSELRSELESSGTKFRSNCDTEVLLAAYARWGRDCLPRLNGMFAFIIYDSETQTVFAARDRFGVKPLYWWRAPDGTLALASEIKAFTTLAGWRAHLDGQSAYDYLVWGLTDHNGRTMFQGVRPLPPGTFIEIRQPDIAIEPVAVAWYTLPTGTAIAASDDTVRERWRALFTDAVRLRLQADTPVGTALSGGLDSSSIVCITHLLRGSEDRASRAAFSARAHDASFDESEFMEAVVQKTKVSQTCVWPEARDLLDRLSDITWHMDEPFGSASIFAEWKVFETVASTDVKVTLDGHGGDEILAGYREYPAPFLGDLLRRGRLLQFFGELRDLAKRGNVGPAYLFQLVIDNVASDRLRYMLRRITGRTIATPDWIDTTRIKVTPATPFPNARTISELSRSQLATTSLPMQLHWNDRNSMAFSIESRAPFLDFRLVEFTLGLADRFKIHQGISKRILRSAMAGTVPEKILNRRDKMGFVTPEENWVRHEQPDGFRAALHQAVKASRGVLKPEAIEMGNAMIDGRTPYNNRFWRLINFGVWMDRFNVEVAP